MSNRDDAQSLQQAFSLHRSGNFAEAAKLYRKIIKRNPSQPHALHSLGIIETAAGNHAEAARLMARSLQVQPNNIPFIQNYATVLCQLGQFETAAAVALKGLQADDLDNQIISGDEDVDIAGTGVQPAALDFVQTYDDYPVIVMMQFEDLGFCEKGEGAAFVQANTLTHDGSFPNNTSGGQLSAGQAGAAGGFLGMTEAIARSPIQLGNLLYDPVVRKFLSAELHLMQGCP